jgi:hypothetical protein
LESARGSERLAAVQSGVSLCSGEVARGEAGDCVACGWIQQIVGTSVVVLAAVFAPWIFVVPLVFAGPSGRQPDRGPHTAALGGDDVIHGRRTSICADPSKTEMLDRFKRPACGVGHVPRVGVSAGRTERR